MNQTKKELSYFRLKLETYLNDYLPELMADNAFIMARADAALTCYCDAVAQGFTHLEAEAMSSEVLYQGRHLFPAPTLCLLTPYYLYFARGKRDQHTPTFGRTRNALFKRTSSA